MPITLNANGKDITVTGGTSGAPVTWEDIVAADASGGWGRITTLNAATPAQYLVAADTLIYIGDNGATSTYVAVERCQITFTNGYFQIRGGGDVTKATLRVGRTNSGYFAVALTMRGLTTDNLVRLAGAGTFLMYWSQLFLPSHLVAYSLTVDVRNSMVVGNEWWGGKNVTLTDSILQIVSLYSSPANPTFAFSRCTLAALNTYATPLFVTRDVVFGTFYSRNGAVTPAAYLYDTSYTSISSINSTGPQFPVNYEYSTLNLSVMDGAGAAVVGAEVVVRDVGGATVYSGVTDAAGGIPRQDVLFRTRTILGGNNNTSDVAHTPHTVTITKAGYTPRVLTLDMNTRHDEIEVLEPLPDFPAVSDVRLATAYDDGSKLGTLALPPVSDVRLATAYDDGSKLGTLALPATGDVRAAIAYDDGSKVGTLALPATGDVRLATAYDDGSKVGTLALPATGDVRAAIAYDDGSKLGTLALPAATNVLSGVGYGAAGSEFTGTLEQSVTVGEGITATITEDVLTVAIND